MDEIIGAIKGLAARLFGSRKMLAGLFVIGALVYGMFQPQNAAKALEWAALLTVTFIGLVGAIAGEDVGKAMAEARAASKGAIEELKRQLDQAPEPPEGVG